jgi:hypothetical protein
MDTEETGSSAVPQPTAPPRPQQLKVQSLNMDRKIGYPDVFVFLSPSTGTVS